MRVRLITAALSTALALTVPAAADQVHLTNGKTFDDVVARVGDSEVVIELPGGGEITLPAHRVERVERGRTPLEIFRERTQALRAEPTTDAGDWLRLAAWAREHDLVRGRRQAALTAARLAPEDPGVRAEMHLLGYVLDSEVGDWVTVPESMRRRGLVRFDGRWVTPEERDRQIRLAQKAARDRARDQRLDRLTRAIEATTELELAKTVAAQSQPTPPPAPPTVFATPYPLLVLPGYFYSAPAPAPAPQGGEAPADPAPAHTVNRSGFERASHAPGKLGTDTSLAPGRLGPGRSSRSSPRR